MPRAIIETTPDAALIATCALALDEHDACVATIEPVENLPRADPRRATAWGKMRHHQDVYLAAVEQAATLPAMTTAGLAAKARLALGHLDGAGCDENLALSLARDVLAVCSAAPKQEAG